MRDRDSTTVPQTQLAEKTVKFILIHASVDSLNSLDSVNSENHAPFRESPNRIGYSWSPSGRSIIDSFNCVLQITIKGYFLL